MVDDYYGSGDRQRDTDRYGSDDPHGTRHTERPRGWGCLSWIFILTMVGFLIYIRDIKSGKGEHLPPLDDTAASMSGVMEFQARGRIGLGELLRQYKPNSESEVLALYKGDPADPASQAEHAAMWRRGTFGQRLQYVILSGELAGPPEALELLGKLKWDWETAKLQPSAQQLDVFNSLRKAYQDYRKKKYDAPSVVDTERQLLLGRLGWYGRLALTPRDAPDQLARQSVIASPLRLVYGLMGVVCFILGMGLLGTLGMVVFALGTAGGAIRIGLREGSGSSGVYAETFAIWMFVFTGGLLALEFWPWHRDRFVLNLLVMFGSLLVLVWPVVRGISWAEVRQDLGLTRGRAGWFEPLMGIPGYALMLPMLAVGFTITFILLQVWMKNAGGGGGAADSPFEPQHMISHPIVNEVMTGGFWIRFQLVLLACVAAPIVEEIMFRGVLYRHLRDATNGWGWILSCVVSALWTSFIFAVIHPQGMIAVPALMAIACGCTLTREWRDSLWASMVIHGINNSLICTFLLLGSP
jgi:membrane protease YdiL (CAAX protease family)